MNPVRRLSAFAYGAAAAIVVLAGIEVVRAQPTKGAVIPGCADSEGNLRLTELTIPCRPGERRLRINPPRIDDNQTCEENNDRAQRLESRIKDLEYRARRGTLRGTRVAAPFEVVTKAEQRLLFIEEQSVTFYNLAGKPVVWILADQSGGNLQTQSTTGLSAAIGALDKTARVLIQENDRDRIDLGRNAAGLYRLRVFGAQQKVVAGLGQSSQGTGVALVNDADENPKAAMLVPPGTSGQVKLWNAKGTEVAFLTVDSLGAGRFELTDASSNLMVQAGLTGGVGLLRTGPGMYNSGVGILGLAPSFIIGSK